MTLPEIDWFAVQIVISVERERGEGGQDMTRASLWHISMPYRELISMGDTNLKPETYGYWGEEEGCQSV